MRSMRASGTLSRAFTSTCSYAIACITLASLACFAPVTSALAAPEPGGTDLDQYTLAISPATVAAGSTTTLTFTFTNSPGNAEAANGANFNAPAGYHVLSATLPASAGGTATVAGNVVELRNFVDKAGKPMQVKVTVRAPSICGNHTGSWGSSGWENDAGFPSDREPLTFVATGSAVTTTVDTPCHRGLALRVTPGAVTAGHATSFRLYLANHSSIGVSVSSATVVVPRSLDASRASLSAGEKGSLRLRRGVLSINGLRLGAGATLTLRVTATAPVDCGTYSYLWRSAALAGGRLVSVAAGTRGHTTVVNTRCTLRFSTEPHDAAVGDHISGVNFNPSGPPVTVEVVDSAGKLVTSSSASVAIALAKNPGSSSLAGTLNADAVRGIVKFAALSLGKPANGYELAAASKLTGTTDSSAFDEASDGSACAQNITCQTVVKTTAASFEVVANPETSEPNAGSLLESIDVGAPLTCAGYTAVDPNWYSFTMTSVNRSKELSYTVSEPYPTNGTTPLPLSQTAEFCFAAPYEFTTSAGTPAVAGTLPDGTAGYVGLLPSCPASGPCLEPSTMLPSQWDSLCSLWTGYLWSQLYGCGTATLTVDIPAGLSGDPWGRA